MAEGRPWGPVNPNSTHQRWSRWLFRVEAGTKQPTIAECVDNARRFFRAVFKSTVGQVRVNVAEAPGVDPIYGFAVEIEGPPVHDSAYRDAMQRTFEQKFMAPGFGPTARFLGMEAELIAGSSEDGRPATQLVVAPPIEGLADLFRRVRSKLRTSCA